MSSFSNFELASLVKSMVSSYQAEPSISHISPARLPSRDAVIEIIRLLRELLFPGYFGKQDLNADALEFHVGDSLSTLRDRLYEQIRSALRHQAIRCETAENVCAGPEDVDARAEEAVREFMNALPRLRRVLATDVQAAFDGDPAATSMDEIIFSYPGLFAILVHRAAHELYRLKIPMLPRMLSEHAHSRTGVDIHPGANVGESFFIDHGTGIVIGETVIIGRNVKIYQGVTLGALSTRGGQALKGVKRHPTLEDGVTVYSGASVLGGDTVIGEGAVINGNAFVTQSVPPHTRVNVKNPELQYRNRQAQEFKQDVPWDWVI